VISLDDEEHWATWKRFTEQFCHTVQQLDPRTRPTLAVLVYSGNDLEMPSADVSLGVAYWKGIITEADVLTLAEFSLPGANISSVVRAVVVHSIANIALWDADLASRLGVAKLDEILRPLDLLRKYAIERGWTANTPASEAEGTTSYVNSELRVHSALLAIKGQVARLDQRLWRAQAAVLLPWVEERRLDFIDVVKPFLGATFKGPLSEVEIGQLTPALMATDAPNSLKRRANELRNIRNAIAHRHTLALRELKLIGDCAT